MDNKILFQGKRTDNGKWVDGYYLGVRPNLTTMQPEPCTRIFTSQFIEYEIDPATVGQFTGKTDRKGNRVFVYSRIKHLSPDGLHAVYGSIAFGDIPTDFETHGSHLGFYIVWDNDGANDWNNLWRHDLGYWLGQESTEVIGTIFNKEVAK